MEKELKTGTTTIGIRTKDAIVLAADTRATFGHINYDEDSPKLYEISSHLGLSNAGSVGDSLAVIRFLKSQAKLYEIERETRMTAKAATSFLSNILNSNRYYPFMVQFLIGGFNDEPGLFELTADGGALERKKYGATGSGTELALTTLDQNYKEDMAEAEAVELAVKAIEAGKRRDIFSGGLAVSVMIIDKNGIREMKKNPAEKKSA